MLQKIKQKRGGARSGDDWHGKPLQERPGFLIRRLHQIHVALFMEECAAESITPVQYSILTALEHMGSRRTDRPVERRRPRYYQRGGCAGTA